MLCQLEVPAETVAAAAAAAPAGALFCLNTAPPGPVPTAVLDRADLVVANRAEHAEVDGLDRARLVAVTAGAEGAVLLAGGREVARAAPPAVTAVDGTGAGDAFTAALVVGLLGGLDRVAALRRACVAGAAAASRPGAQPALPRPSDLAALEGRVSTPLLIDCDPGIDDAVALLLACASPEVRLLGVSTVGGNVGLEHTTRNARRLLTLAGRPDVPVAAGAPRPLVRPRRRGPRTCTGTTGSAGCGCRSRPPRWTPGTRSRCSPTRWPARPSRSPWSRSAR